jgi:hypothetical protein
MLQNIRVLGRYDVGSVDARHEEDDELTPPRRYEEKSRETHANRSL